MNKLSHESEMVRDAIVVALRTSRTSMTASDLLAFMPWHPRREDWDCTECPNSTHLHSDRARTIECHITWHLYEFRPAAGQIYQHLIALERRGIVCRRVPSRRGRRVYWELTSAGAAVGEIADLQRIVDLDNNTDDTATPRIRPASDLPRIDWGDLVTQISRFGEDEFVAGRSHLLTADTYRHATASMIGASSDVHARHLELLHVDIVNSRSMMLYARQRVAIVVADLRDVGKHDVAAAQLVTIFHQAAQIRAHERVLVIIAGPAAASQLDILVPAINNDASATSLLEFQDAVRVGLTLALGCAHLAPDLLITALASSRCAALHQYTAALRIDIAPAARHE